MENFTGLMWHGSIYVIINAFLWALDIIQGDGANWAFWVSITWGIGLASHVAAYFFDESGRQNRRYQRYLEEERARDAGNPTIA